MRRQQRLRRRARRHGFTLIEFIVVATIIGILAALIVPRFFGRIGQAKTAVAKQKIGVLTQKVIEFEADCERFPTAQEGLRALLDMPPELEGKWKGPYVTKPEDIIDPWDRPFEFERPGQKNLDFDIYSLGADGQPGGEDENADVYN